jgi:hypothetical protein
MPREYKKVLVAVNAARESGGSPDDAVLELMSAASKG